jgi:poly-gamma-glutamate synthesis protein (capsule biosynthesis protein)
VRLTFLGDVVLNKEYRIDLGLQNFIFNLEHPLSCDGTPAKNKVNKCEERSYIEETFGKLPLAVNLANNHIADYGDVAFAKTVEFLEVNKIAYFGAGNKKNNFNNPAFVEFEGKKIALLGYSCITTSAVFGEEKSNGSALLDQEKVLNDIELCRDSSDYIIINLHWGDENVRYPKPDDIQKARMFIDAGADLIIGHHAHVIQSFEKYKGKYIFYGLGHFLFPYQDRPANYDGEKFQNIYSPKEEQANREGLIVDMDKDLNISYSTIMFDGECVKPHKANIPRWIPKTQEQYDLYLKFRQKQKMAKSFIKNPRFPSPEQIKRFLGF